MFVSKLACAIHLHEFISLFQSLDVCVLFGLFKWASALHSVRVLMCARVEVFVCLISLSIRAQPLILSWPSSSSHRVCFVMSLSELSFVLLSSFSLSITLCLPFFSLPLDQPSIPKLPWTANADKLHREGGWWWRAAAGETCKTLKQVLSLSVSLSCFHTQRRTKYWCCLLVTQQIWANPDNGKRGTAGEREGEKVKGKGVKENWKRDLVEGIWGGR